MNKQDRLQSIMLAAPVIPVVMFDEIDQALEVSRALIAGGLPAIEITLRTPNALKCMEAVASQVEGAIVGAGTVLNKEHVESVVSAGAQFMVSPGISPKLEIACKEASIPMLPGASTASEMMSLYEKGYKLLKFFPAIAAGGSDFLKSIHAPLPDLKFCPTGGINLNNAGDFLSLSNVLCVGGSWVAPKDLVANRDYKSIEELAYNASIIGKKG